MIEETTARQTAIQLHLVMGARIERLLTDQTIVIYIGIGLLSDAGIEMLTIFPSAPIAERVGYVHRPLSPHILPLADKLLVVGRLGARVMEDVHDIRRTPRDAAQVASVPGHLRVVADEGV